MNIKNISLYDYYFMYKNLFTKFYFYLSISKIYFLQRCVDVKKKSVCLKGCTDVAFFVPFADYSSRKEEGKKIY